MKSQSILVPFFFVLVLLLTIITVQSKCSRGCDRALASYYIWPGSNLSFIARTMKSSLVDPADISYKTMFDYNNQISNVDNTLVGLRINFPFPCDCINGEFLGHVFQYEVNGDESYATIASIYYANLTTVDSLQNTNSYPANNIPDTGTVNVTVNCSCGDRSVSRDYGLFVTYPLRPEDSLASIASSANLNADLLVSYNPGGALSRGSGLVFIPGRDENDVYPPLDSASTGGSAFPSESASTGIAGGVIVGISVAAIVVVLFLAALVYFGIYRKRKLKGATLLSTRIHDLAAQNDNEKAAESTIPCANAATILSGITVDKSVEFSYEELARATDNFSIANKIGEGGFGAVYYAELRGEKAAIKKMDMQASREFLAELKVLTHVHHLNLVRLIGYCVEGSLFLVYEFIENGNLSQHLRGSGREPLPWSTRVQIALGSARGLEYIHEHTVPLYIHRDIKSANILIDKNFHAKVADFGLTKLTEAGSASLPTRLVGTFGYMPAEYAQYGDVSPKIDVYAFGVVLYELISAKEAIVKQNGSSAELKGLVALFEEVLNLPDPKEGLHKLVDPKLADNYPLDSVLKMAQLAKVCTQELPQLRPSMRSIVVALMRLSSTTEDWDVGSFYENHSLINLMSGR